MCTLGAVRAHTTRGMCTLGRCRSPDPRFDGPPGGARAGSCARSPTSPWPSTRRREAAGHATRALSIRPASAAVLVRGRDEAEPRGVLPGVDRVLVVHVDAVAAAVDLADAQLDPLERAAWDGSVAEQLLVREQVPGITAPGSAVRGHGLATELRQCARAWSATTFPRGHGARAQCAVAAPNTIGPMEVVMRWRVWFGMGALVACDGTDKADEPPA